MGLFSGSPATPGQGRERSERALTKAAQNGVDVRGALAAGHSLDGGANVYLLVFPDRLELVSTGQVGGVFRSGAGRVTVPLSDVAGVTSRDRLLRGVLAVETAAATLEFATDKAVAAHLRDVIDKRRTAGPGDEAGALLRHLAELHAAGVLTDEEYAAKRAGLL